MKLVPPPSVGTVPAPSTRCSNPEGLAVPIPKFPAPVKTRASPPPDLWLSIDNALSEAVLPPIIRTPKFLSSVPS